MSLLAKFIAAGDALAKTRAERAAEKLKASPPKLLKPMPASARNSPHGIAMRKAAPAMLKNRIKLVDARLAREESVVAGDKVNGIEPRSLVAHRKRRRRLV